MEECGAKLGWLSVLMGDPGGKNSGKLSALWMRIWRWSLEGDSACDGSDCCF